MMQEAARKNAIEVKDVSIQYRILNNISLRKTLFHKKKRMEVFEAVRHVSFTVPEGGILGITGKNGSGKSTLLKSIAGIFSPNSGSIDIHNHTVSLMALGVGFKYELTGRMNVLLSGLLLGFSREEIEKRMDSIIDFAEIGEFIDKPVRTYSSGMHAKLAFAITAMLETDIMLVDEVLSVGDERFRQKSMNRMRELISDEDRTVVIVSHDLGFLNDICDEILWMHDGEIREMGKPDEVLPRYAAFMAE